MASSLDDWSLANVYREGGDVYRTVVAPILDKEIEDITDSERQIGKTLVLSIMYGGGVPTIMHQLDVEVSGARRLLREFKDQWPGLVEFDQQVRSTLFMRGHIKTIAGRHLHPEKEYTALNALIQGSAAELMRDSLLKTSKWLKGWDLQSHIVCTVHDSMMLDVYEPELTMILSYLPALMSNDMITEYVPIEVDMSLSNKSWADMEEWKS